MAKFCRYCGKPVREGAKFCKHCGQSLAKSNNPQAQQPHANTTPVSVQNIKQNVSAPQIREIVATAAKGEVDLGGFGLGSISSVTKPVSEVLSPFKGLVRSITSLLGGIGSLFKNPLSLIVTILMAVLWFVLARYKDTDLLIIRILSWLTYAEGSYGRSIPGMIGGILGMGTVAATYTSLFNGGIVNAGKGIVALFKGHGKKRSIVCIIIGVVIGGLLYFIFAGRNISADTAMAGIAGTVLSLEALGGCRGKLYSLVQAVTSKTANGVRSAMQGRIDGMLTGMTIGFAVATIVFSFGFMEGIL